MRKIIKTITICTIILLLVAFIAIILTKKGFLANLNTDISDGKSDYTSQYNVTQYISEYDADGDGIDDQSDILQSAKEYIATKPQYRSQYYNTGYSNNGYGVCTDVVAFAMRNSGYDIMQLVNQDIVMNQSEYNIEKPDVNIDFRRVVNLDTYFKHTAESLSINPKDINEWQGGDIVVFEHHIGIVSDKRNVNGVNYVIHHNDPFQDAYEEDILESRQDIVGHYRIKSNKK